MPDRPGKPAVRARNRTFSRNTVVRPEGSSTDLANPFRAILDEGFDPVLVRRDGLETRKRHTSRERMLPNEIQVSFEARLMHLADWIVHTSGVLRLSLSQVNVLDRDLNVIHQLLSERSDPGLFSLIALPSSPLASRSSRIQTFSVPELLLFSLLFLPLVFLWVQGFLRRIPHLDE